LRNIKKFNFPALYGIVHRKVFGQVPPKVEYSLTAYGKTLAPILQLIANWGINHRAKTAKGRIG